MHTAVAIYLRRADRALKQETNYMYTLTVKSELTVDLNGGSDAVCRRRHRTLLLLLQQSREDQRSDPTHLSYITA